MRNKLRLGIVGLSALLCSTCLFCACGGNNTPPPPTPPDIEYTVDESVLTSGKDANATEFYAKNVAQIEDSPLAGKTIYWLGSSVTYGASSGGESMADFLAAKTGAICKKDAVSGTTIFDDGASENTGVKSYTRRLTNSTVFDKNEYVDAFICQISTNDAWGDRSSKRGYVEDISVQDKDAFNLATTMGGVEYIISYVSETWGCPIYFYSGSYFGDSGTGNRTSANPTGTNYSKLIDDVKVAVRKWQELGCEIDVIDMYNDEDFNAQVSDDYYKWCTSDAIHPKRAGYLNWWMPYFEQYLIVKLCDY
ncbi:MAG: SGNH/GDSL hydrolase family protein [Clostridia bacterium]|nr:SGNH/GDSL hydrolase family protein [Clostridia bacterium]